MAVPKRRTSSAKRRMRRSHHARQPFKLTACLQCKRSIVSHTACPYCGTYRGHQVIDVLAKLTKKERKEKEQELARHKEAAGAG